VLLDFGKAFGRYSAYFDGVFIKDRAARGLLDPMALGLIPPLRGLLREDLIPALSISDLEIHTLPPEGHQRGPRVRVDLQPAAREVSGTSGAVGAWIIGTCAGTPPPRSI